MIRAVQAQTQYPPPGPRSLRTPTAIAPSAMQVIAISSQGT